MRWLLIGLGCLALASCSQRQEAGEAASSADRLAFQYDYSFRLPSDRIAAAQERHAQACERLGPARCRITGMHFTVDGSGTVGATLAVRLAASTARAFGRERVADIEAAGGALAGAEIAGTESPETTEPVQSAAEVARLDAQLARSGLSGAERAELTRQREAAGAQARSAEAAGAAAREALLTTPVSFSYQAGRGVGAAAMLTDAGRTAWASLLTSVSALLTVLATLGPPALVLLALFLLWRRWGRAAWSGILARTGTAAPALAD